MTWGLSKIYFIFEVYQMSDTQQPPTQKPPKGTPITTVSTPAADTSRSPSPEQSAASLSSRKAKASRDVKEDTEEEITEQEAKLHVAQAKLRRANEVLSTLTAERKAKRGIYEDSQVKEHAAMSSVANQQEAIALLDQQVTDAKHKLSALQHTLNIYKNQETSNLAAYTKAQAEETASRTHVEELTSQVTKINALLEVLRNEESVELAELIREDKQTFHLDSTVVTEQCTAAVTSQVCVSDVTSQTTSVTGVAAPFVAPGTSTHTTC
jgi:hypothetical protein